MNEKEKKLTQKQTSIQHSSTKTFRSTRLLLFTLFFITIFTIAAFKPQKQPIHKQYFEISKHLAEYDNNDTVCIEFNTCDDQCQCAIDNSNSPDQACRNDASFVNYLI